MRLWLFYCFLIRRCFTWMGRSAQVEVAKFFRMETVNLAQQSAVNKAVNLAQHCPQKYSEVTCRYCSTWRCLLVLVMSLLRVLLRGADACLPSDLPVWLASLRVGNSNSFSPGRFLAPLSSYECTMFRIYTILEKRKELNCCVVGFILFFYFLFSSCSRDSSICGWAVPIPPLPVCGSGDNVLAVDCINLFHYSVYSWPSRPLKQLQTASPSHFKPLGVWFRSELWASGIGGTTAQWGILYFAPELEIKHWLKSVFQLSYLVQQVPATNHGPSFELCS